MIVECVRRECMGTVNASSEECVMHSCMRVPLASAVCVHLSDHEHAAHDSRVRVM